MLGLVWLVCALHGPKVLLPCCSTVLSTLPHGSRSCSSSCCRICIPISSNSSKWEWEGQWKRTSFLRRLLLSCY